MKHFRIFVITFLISTYGYANDDIEDQYVPIVKEQPTYKKFKENLGYMFEIMLGYSGLHREAELQGEASFSCIHQQQMVKMLNLNKKFQPKFDHEYKQDGKTYSGMQADFEESVQKMKPYCDKVNK